MLPYLSLMIPCPLRTLPVLPLQLHQTHFLVLQSRRFPVKDRNRFLYIVQAPVYLNILQWNYYGVINQTFYSWETWTICEFDSAQRVNPNGMQPSLSGQKPWRDQYTWDLACPSSEIGWSLSKVKPLEAPCLQLEIRDRNFADLHSSSFDSVRFATFCAPVESNR